VGFGLGVGPFPEWRVVGVGLATAFGNVFTAVAFVAAIRWDLTHASFTRPRDLTIARQLLSVSAPRVAEGLVATAVEFPFNSLLLTFGTDVNAAYQIGRRMYQQVSSTLSRVQRRRQRPRRPGARRRRRWRSGGPWRGSDTTTSSAACRNVWGLTGSVRQSHGVGAVT